MEQLQGDIDFLVKFTERFANAAVCPVARDSREENLYLFRKELDEESRKRKEKSKGGEKASYELHNHIHRKHFNPVHPETEKIDIQDIAHALSLTCRGNGHVSSFLVC